MKLTLFQTAESLDPADLADNPMQSLTAYVTEVSAEISRVYPEIEIEHVHMEGLHSWRLDSDLDDQSHDEYVIQGITEAVYAVGNFWA